MLRKKKNFIDLNSSEKIVAVFSLLQNFLCFSIGKPIEENTEGKKIGKGNTFTARAFFNKKKKKDVKSHHQYINQEKNETKTRIIKKTGIKLELSSRTIAENRENNATQTKKLRGCPLVRAAQKIITSLLLSRNINKIVLFFREKTNVVQCVNQFHEIFLLLPLLF